MQKKAVLILVGVVLTLMICGVLLALNFINKPHVNAGSLDPVFRLDASGLFGEYSRDEAAANRKFVDKVIEVKGTVLDREETDSTMSVLLSTGDPVAAINCSFRLAGHEKLNLPPKGGLVTIKGKCAGFLNDVNVVDCVIE